MCGKAGSFCGRKFDGILNKELFSGGWALNCPTETKSTMYSKLSINMKILSQSYKSGGCEMEFFNFLWLILDNYETKVPTKNNRPP